MSTEKQEYKSDVTLWERIGTLERHSAAQIETNRGIFGALEEIRDVMTRIQENNRPNLGGMFLVLLATCTFLVTIGGLTMAPVYREQARTYEALTRATEVMNEMRSNRFTADDGATLEHMLENRLRENETTFYATRERLAFVEGVMGINVHGVEK